MNECCTKERFLDDIKNHVMTIELDNGLHRSILFKRPNSVNKHFRITTWKGHLAISGDMGCYVFSRLEDMFDFFETAKDDLSINLGYWCEKMQSCSLFGYSDKGINPYNVLDIQATINCIKETMADWDDLDYKGEMIEELENCEDKRDIDNFCTNYQIDDWYEYLSYKPTFHIVWCLYAIRYAIMQYNAK